jgi:threonine aldolase
LLLPDGSIQKRFKERKKMMNKSFNQSRFLGALFLLLLALSSASAQEFRATVTGRLKTRTKLLFRART